MSGTFERVRATLPGRIQDHSLIRWAGSKRRLLPKLKEHIGKTGATYVEPFCGSAALFFSMKPKRAILADSNSALIETLRWVRDDHQSVYRALTKFAPSEEVYYAVRTSYNRGDYQDADAAGVFLYLNRHCFNGLWRTNASGDFNVPFGGASATPLNLKALTDASKALEAAEIICGDFRETLSAIDGEDVLIFADPPYSTSLRRTFTEYGPSPFNSECLADLAKELRRLGDEGARVMVSYCNDPVVLDHFSGWTKVKMQVTRNVGGFADRRRIAEELLISNFETANAR